MLIDDMVALGVFVVSPPQKLCFLSLEAIPAKASASVGDDRAFDSSPRWEEVTTDFVCGRVSGDFKSLLRKLVLLGCSLVSVVSFY